MKKFFLTLLFLLFLGFAIKPIVTAKPSTSINSFRITYSGKQQNNPHIWGRKVIWDDWRGADNIDIWIYDLDTKTEAPLIVKPNNQRNTGFWKNKIVYFDSSTNPPCIRVYSLKTKEDIEIFCEDNIRGGPIYGNKVLYLRHFGNNGGDLYVHSINTGKSKFIASRVSSPRIWLNKIVWTEVLGSGYYNVKGYDLIKNRFFNISSVNNGYQKMANIYGNTVVWVDQRNGSPAIYKKNLATGVEKVIYQTTTSRLERPDISQKFIVWVDDRGFGAHDIFAYNRNSGELVELCNNGPQGPSPTIPDIYKNTVVWMSWHTGNGDIYGATIH